MNFYVHGITHEADGIASFEFRPESGEIEPVTPGAHIDVVLPNGLTRQYSLINTAGETTGYRVAVKRDPKSRGGSHYMHDSLRVGTPVTITGPRNNFPLSEDAAHSVFIAGGIGVTPIVSMIERLTALGKTSELVYAVRSKRDVAFHQRLTAAAGKAHVHVDEVVGGIFDVAAHLKDLPPDTHIYCCGPGPMLDAFVAATADRDPAYVHLERFTAEALPPREGAFVVELARSGKTVEVEDGESILAALRKVGIEPVTSCEEGVCGTCETRVLEGIPDHRDVVLSNAERAANKTMMICCSGSASPRLVLDL
jgi:vanillate O-demethylase ferredoxin subunit